MKKILQHNNITDDFILSVEVIPLQDATSNVSDLNENSSASCSSDLVSFITKWICY